MTVDQALLNQVINSNGSYLHELATGQQTTLFWNIVGAPTGSSPTIQFTLSEIDPSDRVTPIGQTVSSQVLSGAGTGQVSLTLGTSSLVLLSWAVGGGTPSFPSVSAALITRDQPNQVAVTPATSATTNLATATFEKITDGTHTAAVTAASALQVDGSAVTQPVSGTVTAVVSGTVTSNQGTAGTLAGAWPVEVTDGTHTLPTMDVATRKAFVALTDGTNTAAVKAASTAPVAADPAAVVAISPNSLTAKGTQPTSAVPTQNLKDSGRTRFLLAAKAIAGVTSEAMVTLTPVRGTTAGSTGTTFAVTAGKTLRLIAIVLAVKNTTTTQIGAMIHLRIDSTSVTVSSQIWVSVFVTTPTATALGVNSIMIPLPDGLELSGAEQLGVSQICNSASSALDIEVLGFEY